MESDLLSGPIANKTVSSEILFSDFSKTLEEIAKLPATRGGVNSGVGKNEAKGRILQKFIDQWRSKAKSLVNKELESNGKSVDDNFFQALRLLLPHEDRRIYGLKEVKLATLIIETLGISKTTEDGKKLLNYRQHNSNNVDGDFAGVAYFVLKSRCYDKKNMTIYDVNMHLDKISKGNEEGKNGQNSVKSSITHFLTNLSAEQLKWLIRIILKDLKIGIKENFILSLFHPDALDLYNFTSSLEKVCDTLNDPTKRLHEIGVSVMTPCRPMLGEKTQPNKIEEIMHKNEFYIETKFDGERFQLHKKGNTFAYFSRNSKDYTDKFGQDSYSGTLTPFIYKCFSNDVNSLIIDGEMCGYDTTINEFLCKSDDFDVKSGFTSDKIQRCFCVYDILLYNDVVLTNKPLKERIKYLEKAFTEVEGRIVFSKRQIANSNKQVVEALNDAIDSRLEGIVVKNPNSVYKPSIRSGSGWYKVKPDYMLGLNDDLDLIIVGGYYGKGRRSGLLSHFLLAVALDDANKGDDNLTKDQINQEKGLDFEDEAEEKIECVSKKVSYPSVFYSFCKIGSGYTMKELNEFNQKLKDKWKPYDKKNPPKHLEVTYEKPDMWIEPKDSLIVQVKAVEISTSDKYKTGVTLRFPRLEAFRPDKNWHECMKLSELDELNKKNEGKLASGKHFNLDDYDEDGNLIHNDEDDEPLVKKKKSTSQANKKGILSDRFRGIDSSSVVKINDSFKDRQLCVMIDMGNEELNKKLLEKGIVELGGDIVQNPTNQTHCIIASKLIHKLNAYIKNDLYDIVKVDWLIKCIKENKYIDWKPKDMMYTKTATKLHFRKLYDSYGDSYMEDLSIDNLKEIFKNMDETSKVVSKEKENNFIQVKKVIALFENKYFPDESSQFGLFRLVYVYLDVFESLQTDSKQIKNSPLDLIGLKIKWRGGYVYKEIDEDTTHCILDKNDQSRLDKIKKVNHQREKKFHIVSSEWVAACIESGRLISELPFHL